jgi:hypothetical protein
MKNLFLGTAARFFVQKEVKTNYSILKDSQEFFTDKLSDPKTFIYLNKIALPIKVKVLIPLIILFVIGVSNSSRAQTLVPEPDLNDLDLFMLYSAAGAVNSFGSTTVSGNIGTHAGTINNFNVAANTMFIGDALTLSCYNRLFALRNDLINISYPLDSDNMLGTLTTGKTFLRGRHRIGMATTVDGILTFDAQNNVNSVFIVHIVGALSIHQNVTMVLANGAKSANIFWVADGAVELLTNTVAKGTFIGGGIMDVLAGTSLDGRIFTTAGAINIYSSSLTVASNNLVTLPIITAVTDNPAAVNGLTGGNTTSLTLNDILNGTAVVIGTAQGNVILTGITVPTALTLNANGTVTIAPNTPAGSYNLTYKICEVTNPTNCSTVTSNVTVTPPIITAVTDNPATINGLTGGNTTSLTLNDILNGTAVIIGALPGNVILTGITVPIGLTLNANGTVSVAPNTPAGSYNITYKICEVTNPTNCSTVTSVVTVILSNFSLTIDIDALVFVAAGDAKDFVVNISEINGSPSGGQVIVQIIKQSAFLITYGAATNTSNVNGGVSVNNSDWLITENGSFIVLTLKTTTVIGANSISAIGFTIARQPNVPAHTSQPITATILNGTGSDVYNFDNSYNTIVKAQ